MQDVTAEELGELILTKCKEARSLIRFTGQLHTTNCNLEIDGRKYFVTFTAISKENTK